MAISGSSLKSPISNLKFRNLTFSTAQHVCKLHVEPATIKFQNGYFRQSSQISNFKFEIPQLTSATAQHVCKLHWEPAHICTIAFRSPLQATPRIGFGEEKCAGIGIFHGES